MGDLLPDHVPGEPKWLAGARTVLVVLTAVAFAFSASSYFVWVMGR